MQPTVSFFVAGHPEPAGSKQAFVPQHPRTKQIYRDKHGRVVVSVVDANSKSKAWKAHIASTARICYRGAPLAGPVVLYLTFTLNRPKGHYGTGRNATTIKASAPRRPTSKPDVLKLARAVEDALTQAGVWGDDAQIVDEHLAKRYGETEGVEIKIIADGDEHETD